MLGYIGEPISLGHVLFETDSSLVRQSYSPRMMATFLNLAGFGMAAWDPRSVRADDPAHLPGDDAPGVRSQPPEPGRQARPDLPDRARARRHLQRARDDRGDEPAPVPLPRRRASCWRTTVTCASSRACATTSSGTSGPSSRRGSRERTDSEWIYALVLSQLEDPYGVPEARELADAAVSALRLLREVRARHGIDTSSPVNLCLTTGRRARRHAVLVRLRLVPGRGRAARDRPAVREPLVHARRRVRRCATASSAMTASDTARSLLIASEPLTVDTSTWLEVPEYSMITAARHLRRARLRDARPRCLTPRPATTPSARRRSRSSRTVPLLDGIPEAELAELAGLLRRRELAAGEVLWHEGDEAVGDGPDRRRARLGVAAATRGSHDRGHDASGAGEVLGEVPLLDGGQHSATVRVIEPDEPALR